MHLSNGIKSSDAVVVFPVATSKHTSTESYENPTHESCPNSNTSTGVQHVIPQIHNKLKGVCNKLHEYSHTGSAVSIALSQYSSPIQWS